MTKEEKPYNNNYKFMEDKKRDVKKLAERFKTENDGYFFKELMSNKVISGVFSDWYWNMQSIK